jgi:hypothetical protein
MLEAGVDVIVLGCTHFLHLSEEFAELAGPGVAIVDSRDGVAARLAHLVGSLGHRGETTEARGDTTGRGGSTGAWIDAMYLTGPGEFGPVYAGFASLFGLSPAGTLA